MVCRALTQTHGRYKTVLWHFGGLPTRLLKSRYPEKLPASRFLAYYATRLNTVEINYTYRRLASASTFEKWLAATPEGFMFLPKAHMKITHQLKLEGAEEFTRVFLESLEPLRAGGRLGPILFQLAPSFKADNERLGLFIRQLPRGLQVAFEFRNSGPGSTKAPIRFPRDSNVGLCFAENERMDTPFVGTSYFVSYRGSASPKYLVLDMLKLLAHRVNQYLSNNYPTFAIFKH